MKPALLLALFSLALAGCDPAPQELSGRPLVIQLGVKISTASTPQELDSLQAKVAGSTLGAPVRERLSGAIETQRKLLAGAAEMDLNTRMQTAQSVLTQLEAASNAVE